MVQQSINHAIYGISLCAVVMTVENLSHRKLCGDSLYRQNIPTIEIHCQLMLVFGDGVLRHHLRRGCREFKSGLASIMKITPFSPADQEHVNTAQVVEVVFENHLALFECLPTYET